ncbi:hypothetical protein M2158_006432 [Streptomyces sp. SAI-144]|uniref:hypothetical protein n=1 Tax=unclassified Streptomyces TaxID=2593676 RepID=UPI002475DB22|nr:MULTISPECIES: hypothetical protein [unclassified Streptomyces]MDH6437891.1 hypothetical protein [Streptomyces sp. SAI-144]
MPYADLAEGGLEVGGARAAAEGTVVLGERSRFALTVTVEGGRIASYDVVAEPVRPRRVEPWGTRPAGRISSPSPTR